MKTSPDLNQLIKDHLQNQNKVELESGTITIEDAQPKKEKKNVISPE